MEKLPLEILLNILERLEFSDKLHLAKTCRKLYEVVSKNGLYEEVKLGSGRKAVRILNLFKNKKLDGSQVKRLSIDDLEDWSEEIYKQFTDIFPNVTELINPTGFMDYEEPREWHSLEKWTETLESCTMGTDHIQVVYLLEDYECPRMKYLEISPYTDFSDLDRMFSISILSCIGNAPNLEELVVKEDELDIDFLESLHNVCNAKKLTFDTVLFNIGDADLPESIEPAINIKYLEFTPRTVVADKKGVLLKYIARKYTNLEVLVIGFHFQDSLLDYFSAAGIVNIEDEFYADERAETIEEDYNVTSEVYLNRGASSLVSHLPSTLKELVVQQQLFSGVEEALEKSNCNAKLSFIKRKSYYY